MPEPGLPLAEFDRAPAAPPGRWIEGMSADRPLLDALAVIFRQRFEGVLYYLPLAAEHADDDIGHVHKLRVACRRLGAVLDVLAEGLPEAPRQALLKYVNSIRRSCGKARDLDVRRTHLDSLLRMASVDETVVLELVCQTIVRARKKVQRKLSHKLPRLQAGLNQAGEDLFAALRTVQRTAGEGYASFGRTGRRILMKELAALWDIASGGFEDAAPLHQLRIACKHLRYAFEVFMPVLPGEFREDFYPQLENIQELLGEFHDAAEATLAFRRMKKKWKGWRGTRKWVRHGLSDYHWRELRSGLDSVLLAYAQQSDHARTEFLDLWPGFSGASFRLPVTELLEADSESSPPRTQAEGAAEDRS
ncbi:MAG: CHAD domain-containing protein [Planctomycetia bacterium]|nr:CHAD domain-containing protein [Planctomycetia bacterium]